jgi:uncharacterized protein
VRRPRDLLVPVAELRRRPGNRTEVDLEVPAGGLATSSASVPAEAVARVHLVLESQSDGVTVAGRVGVPWEGACRRCLDPCGGDLEVEVAEVFSDHPDGLDLLPFSGDAVDLTAAVTEAIVLGLPLAPLCRSDCPGPEPAAFPVAVESDAPAERRDPRWAALDELRFDPGEPGG